jgi:hypothetical protein
MTMRYKTTRADDATLRQRMKAIAHERRRFGYRRLRFLASETDDPLAARLVQDLIVEVEELTADPSPVKHSPG